MKAWEIRNGILGFHKVKPVCAAEGEALVRITHAGICGSDLPKLRRPGAFTLPDRWRPGHEIVGTDPTGRTVAVDPLIPCRACGRCVAGDGHLCPSLRRIGWDLPGGFAEQVAVPAINVRPIPSGVSPLHAVLVDPAAVAIHGLRCSPVGPPGRLAVVGAGTVGLLTALYAAQRGWDVTVVHRDRRPLRRSIGDAIPATFESSRMSESKYRFDVVVDAARGTGPEPLETALRLVRNGGTVVVQNAYQPDVYLSTPLREVFGRSLRLIGSFSYCQRNSDDFDLGLRLLDQCKDAVAPLVSPVGGLTDLEDIVLRRRPRQAGRQVLLVDEIYEELREATAAPLR